MSNYNHTVSGVYLHDSAAATALSLMIAQGLPEEQLQIIQSSQEIANLHSDSESKAVLNEVLVDGAVGTVLGAGAFGLGHLALVGANISLFVASPILGPLIMLGWGASIGGLLGAAAGATVNPVEADNKDKQFSDLVKDAIKRGCVVLVAQTMTIEETRIAQNIIRDSVKESGDMTTV